MQWLPGFLKHMMPPAFETIPMTTCELTIVTVTSDDMEYLMSHFRAGEVTFDSRKRD